ncbi:MAG: hypothetical protein RMM98_14330 [Acidobacteriota bacterium]|nr:hypothetical protein [Blastocatellia bacterium]MDW8240782.1 hypothetical protein [Acidobacteriota bacterium]
MKLLSLWMLTTLAIVSIVRSATMAQDAPDIVVLKVGWSKERINWEANPFGGPNESYDEMRVRINDERRLEAAKRGGSTADQNKLERELRTYEIMKANKKPPPLRYAYRYRCTVQNTGTKTIKLIDWDYVFLDPETQAEVGRHQFTSEEKIGPGKKKDLEVFIKSPPGRIVSANVYNSEGLHERVVIVRVEYTDGSVWQRP